jgi:hypothetical protein
VTALPACDDGKVEPGSPGSALLGEDAFESSSWDTSALGEADAALANSKGMERKMFRNCWPRVEICALEPIVSWALD